MGAETVCPVTTDGFHKKRPWQERHTERSGLACVACHKTWEHTRAHGLQPTYKEQRHGG